MSTTWAPALLPMSRDMDATVVAAAMTWDALTKAFAEEGADLETPVDGDHSILTGVQRTLIALADAPLRQPTPTLTINSDAPPLRLITVELEPFDVSMLGAGLHQLDQH
jgi:hypothetical protein